ncbi:MAG: resolvase [Cyanobacteriota bacterium]|jgi:RNase H-fold protein (predicted Holliday junction resolvase)
MGALAGLDPGRSKCGLARTDCDCLQVVEAWVLPPDDCYAQLLRWHRQGLISALVLGDGTGSQAWRLRLEDLLPLHVVDERHSTLTARQRYWQLEPVRGWRRLLPAGLRQPPRDWDDIVAQVLLERWLGHTLKRPPAQ